MSQLQLGAGLTKSWLKMGAELEGSWNTSRRTVASKVRGAQDVKDDSVHIGFGDAGEIITRPHDDLDALCKDIEELYPDNVHPTCGFHVHTSFTPIATSVIASRGFYDYFKGQWNTWGKAQKLAHNHEFWGRLAGTNKNTRDEFNPEVQLKGDGRGRGAKGGPARYTILNFYSWEIHRTVECRLLPMFQDKELSIKAVRHLAWIYDSYLDKHGFDAVVFEAATQVRGDTVVERYERPTPSIEPMKFETTGFYPALKTGEGVFYALDGATDDMLPFKQHTGKMTP